MSRKFDAPFVQVSCWIPFRWMEIWQLVKDHPQFQTALRDALQQILRPDGSESEDSQNV